MWFFKSRIASEILYVIEKKCVYFTRMIQLIINMIFYRPIKHDLCFDVASIDIQFVYNNVFEF